MGYKDGVNCLSVREPRMGQPILTFRLRSPPLQKFHFDSLKRFRYGSDCMTYENFVLTPL